VLNLHSYRAEERSILVEIAIILPMLVAGFGCGVYLRNRVVKNRRSFYVAELRGSPAAVPSPNSPEAVSPPIVKPERVKAIAPSGPQRPNSPLDVARPVSVLDFKKISMSDELRELLSLLPSDAKQEPPAAKR
jgi:hypothetical protein